MGLVLIVVRYLLGGSSFLVCFLLGGIVVYFLRGSVGLFLVRRFVV